MRNIYDIIAEQKALVDVEICSRELSYLAEEFDYIQEGVGESIKNVAKKIVEFIKSIIKKIREFISKIFSFFKTRDQKVQGLDNRIKKASEDLQKHNNEKPRKSAQEIMDEVQKKNEESRKQLQKELDENKRKYKEDVDKMRKEDEDRIKAEEKEREDHLKEIQKRQQEIKDEGRREAERQQELHDALGINIVSLDDLLSKSKRTFVGKRYGMLKRRIEFLKTFERAVDNVSGMNVSVKELRENDIDYLHDKLVKKLFLKSVNGNNEIKNQLLVKTLRDGESESETLKLDLLAPIIDEYCKKGSVYLKTLSGVSKKTIDELEAVAEYLEDLQLEAEEAEEKNPNRKVNPNEKTAKDCRMISLMYDQLVRTVNLVFNTLITSTTNAYNFYTSIAIKVTDDYCKKVSERTGKQYGY